MQTQAAGSERVFWVHAQQKKGSQPTQVRMSTIALILLVMSVCSNIYHVLTALCGIFFHFRPKAEMRGDNWPKAACLKPLCGYDVETLKNINSFLDQDYPDYEVIFGWTDG